MQQYVGDLNDLRLAAEKVARLVVNCRKCSSCCENGLVYVLAEEREELESLGVPLVCIDGVYYIQRSTGGACPMLDRKSGKCEIYDSRPVCCRLYPVDVFNRNGTLEWGIYEYCPAERKRESLIVLNNRGRMDYGLLLQAAGMFESVLGSGRISYLGKEDMVSAEYELLDQHRRSFTIIGPVKKCWHQSSH